jgi:hypothetical protein
MAEARKEGGADQMRHHSSFELELGPMRRGGLRALPLASSVGSVCPRLSLAQVRHSVIVQVGAWAWNLGGQRKELNGISSGKESSCFAIDISTGSAWKLTLVVWVRISAEVCMAFRSQFFKELVKIPRKMVS